MEQHSSEKTLNKTIGSFHSKVKNSNDYNYYLQKLWSCLNRGVKVII